MQLDHRHGLQETLAGVAGGLEAHRLELRGQVLDGQLVAGLPGLAAFEQIVGEKTDVGGDLRRRDVGGGSLFHGGEGEQERESEHGALC